MTNLKRYVNKTNRGIEILGYVYPENENFDSVGLLMKYLEQRCWIEGEKDKEVIKTEVTELLSLSDKFSFKANDHVDTLIDNYCHE